MTNGHNATQPKEAISPTLTFPKSRRVLKGSEFDAVFAARLSGGDGVLVLYGKPNELGHARLGMAVSKKVGNAVRRNRWKRLLREAFRLTQHELPAMDFVCLPRLRDEPQFEIVQNAFCRLVQRIEKKAAQRMAATDKPISSEPASE